MGKFEKEFGQVQIKLLQVRNLKKCIDDCINEVNDSKRLVHENEAKFIDLNLKLSLQQSMIGQRTDNLQQQINKLDEHVHQPNDFMERLIEETDKLDKRFKSKMTIIEEKLDQELHKKRLETS